MTDTKSPVERFSIDWFIAQSLEAKAMMESLPEWARNGMVMAAATMPVRPLPPPPRPTGER